MAGDVVDRLEAVEVEQQQAGRRRRSRGPGAGAGERGHQPGPVGQAGQVVGVGQPLELELVAAPAGDVPQVQHHAVPPASAAARRRGTSAGRRPPSATVSNCRHEPSRPRSRKTGPRAPSSSAAGSSARYSSCRSSSWTKSRSGRPSRSRGDQPAGLGGRRPGHLTAVVEHDRDVGRAVHEGAEEGLGAQHLAGQPGAVARPDQRAGERQHHQDGDGGGLAAATAAGRPTRPPSSRSRTPKPRQ